MSSRSINRRSATAALLGLPMLHLAGCGGGGGSAAADEPAPLAGSVQAGSIRSRATGTDYALNLYLPPASAGPASSLPVVYLLDGESWFTTLVNSFEASRTRALIVGIAGSGQRSRDYVPNNQCTSGGGGQAAYFDFIRNELFAHVQGIAGGNSGRRLLFGHSHGGSFVLYAMLAQPPGAQDFVAYLASDSSISCMTYEVYGWLRDYVPAHGRLPTRLHLSYATQGNYSANRDYAQFIEGLRLPGLTLHAQAYNGSHSGIVPQALPDAVAFGLAGGA